MPDRRLRVRRMRAARARSSPQHASTREASMRSPERPVWTQRRRRPRYGSCASVGMASPAWRPPARSIASWTLDPLNGSRRRLKLRRRTLSRTLTIEATIQCGSTCRRERPSSELRCNALRLSDGEHGRWLLRYHRRSERRLGCCYLSSPVRQQREWSIQAPNRATFGERQ
jgi:hypothetical protein